MLWFSITVILAIAWLVLAEISYGRHPLWFTAASIAGLAWILWIAAFELLLLTGWLIP